MVALSGGGTPLVTAGLCTSTSVVVSCNSNAANSVPYQWLLAEWEMITKEASRRHPFSVGIPKANDTKKWAAGLQYLVKKHVGYDLSKRRITGKSVWKKTGISIYGFMKFTREQAALKKAGSKLNVFTIIAPSNEVCAECDTGEEVPCVKQGGIWRCMAQGRGEQVSHRMLYEPLDVCYNLPEMEVVEEEEKKQQLTQVVEDTVVDRLLKHVGFVCGAKVNQPGVSLSDMATAWVDAKVSSQDCTELLSTFNVDLTDMLPNQKQKKLSQMTLLRKKVNTILQQTKRELHTERQRLAGSRIKHRICYVRAL
jgi:hypothetical protein